MTGPIATIAALHTLLTDHPELAATPLHWDIHPNGELTASAPHGAAGGHAAVRALATALGFETVTYDIRRPGTPNATRHVGVAYDATFAGAVLRAWAYEPVAPLPMREVHTDAEQQLCASWIDEHGDPADWSQKTRLTYANTLANLRAGGAL
ncbi:hypothetical protein ACFV1L_18545 [Kitasatospora sp. NPDC059646]|uniref:hypothetical protein n=1 Tax=Kitasatospora sp. NPDC059646 TaxID=3346893 RepID=UPI0036C133D9